jgi:hypothetical protein
MTGWLNFDIHGIVGMRVAAEAPTAAQLRDMFAPFLTEAPLERIDLTVDADLERLEGAVHADDEDRYTDEGLHLGDARVQVMTEGAGFRVHGRGELLTTVLPLVDRVAVRKGVAMIHAATVDFRGRGVLIAGTGGAGKTSTVAKLIGIEGVRFMGDDWAFLGYDGRLLGYAKPMLIRPHHRGLYPHLFKAGAKRKVLIPSWLSAPMGRLATAVHPTIVRYPRVARFFRRWSPEHMMVTPQQAFPAAEFATEAPLAAALYIERADQREVTAEPVDAAWMSARLLGNYHGGLPRHSRDLINALSAAGLDPLHSVFSEKEALLSDALAGVASLLVRVPAELLADDASNALVAQVRDLVGHAEVPA